MSIKAGIWRILASQDKIYILQSLSNDSRIMKNEE